MLQQRSPPVTDLGFGLAEAKPCQDAPGERQEFLGAAAGQYAEICKIHGQKAKLMFATATERGVFLFLAVESANALALDLDLAAVEANLASRPPPAMRRSPRS